MFWWICGVLLLGTFVGSSLIEMARNRKLWGKSFPRSGGWASNPFAGGVVWTLVALMLCALAFAIVSVCGPKEGGESTDYAVVEFGGDMYYVDGDGPHRMSSVTVPRFGDVDEATYRVTKYSWDNWPATVSYELLVPKGDAHGED